MGEGACDEVQYLVAVSAMLVESRVSKLWDLEFFEPEPSLRL